MPRSLLRGSFLASRDPAQFAPRLLRLEARRRNIKQANGVDRIVGDVNLAKHLLNRLAARRLPLSEALAVFETAEGSHPSDPLRKGFLGQLLHLFLAKYNAVCNQESGHRFSPPSLWIRISLVYSRSQSEWKSTSVIRGTPDLSCGNRTCVRLA